MSARCLLRTAISVCSLTVLVTALLCAESSPFRLMGVLLGIGGFILIATCLVMERVDKVNRPADEAFDTGWEIGYDKGWRDCHQKHRPSVVKSIRKASDGMG